jgi:hypothetical protein
MRGSEVCGPIRSTPKGPPVRAARLLLLTAAALALPLLAGCGGSSGSGAGSASSSAAGSGPAASSSTPSSSAAASTSAAAGGGVSCAKAPADVVGAALGDTLDPAAETRNGDTVVVCDYRGSKTGLVKVRIQTDSSAAAFAVEKKGFAGAGMPTKDEAFADEAFSNVLGSGQTTVTTLVARKGSVEILVTAKTTVAQEKALLTQLFARL